MTHVEDLNQSGIWMNGGFFVFRKEIFDYIGEGEELDAIAADSDISGGDTRARDAVLALVSLGYKRPEAVKRVKAVLSDEPSISSAEEMIRKALAG